MERQSGTEWDFGAMLLESLQEARAHKRGELTGLRVTRRTVRDVTVTPAPMYDPSMIAAVRERAGFSQPVFARVLNVSSKTVQNWEQGVRKPDNAARRLIEIIDKHPEVYASFTFELTATPTTVAPVGDGKRVVRPIASSSSASDRP